MEYTTFILGDTLNTKGLLDLLNDNWKIIRADSLPITMTSSSYDIKYGKIVYILERDNIILQKRGGEIYE